MRYTSKTKTAQGNMLYVLPPLDDFDRYSLAQKLGALEDTEEKLGIDADIVFKALENGIYYVLCEGYGGYCIPTLDVRGKCLVKHNVDFDCGIESHWDKYFPLEEHGKTWALTKEELEKLGVKKW